MTFAKAIKILDLLNHDKTILVKEDPYDGQADVNQEDYVYVDSFCKDDEIVDYMKYFTDSKYHFFIKDGVFTGDEITSD